MQYDKIPRAMKIDVFNALPYLPLLYSRTGYCERISTQMHGLVHYLSIGYIK